ncbi:MAG: hypothetical protein ACOX0A_09495 [Thermoguttaceae bacterium]
MKRLLLLCSVAVMVSTIGCGGVKKPDGLPDLQPVTIKLTQGSEPLANAVLNIKPIEPSTTNNFTCGGTSDAKGVTTIVTHGQYKGAPIGKYKVAVSCTVGEGTPPPPSPIDEESARVWKEYQESGATYEEFYVVDPVYSTVESTPLEIEIVKGKNELTLDCGEKVRVPVEKSTGASG